MTVTAAAPVVDTKKTTTGTTSTRDILENIPTARDPWQVIGMTPGAQAARNVGGSRLASRSACRCTAPHQTRSGISKAGRSPICRRIPRRRTSTSTRSSRCRIPGESYARLESNRFQLTSDAAALDVRRGRGHRVVPERPPVPVERPAAAARRRARRGARQLLPLRLCRAARRPADRAHDGDRRLPVGAVAQARARSARAPARAPIARSRAATSCCSSTCRDRWRRPSGCR